MPMAARELYGHNRESYHCTNCQLLKCRDQGTGQASTFETRTSILHTGIQDLAQP